MRDVVVNAAADYRTTRQEVGDTSVRVYTRPGQPSSAILSAAVNAVTKLEARLGAYPWPVLRIVQSSGGLGMEGPGVVWIPAGVAPSNLRYLVMHEVAHQWFYGLVGNDQAREPFADEAITDMVARYLTGTRRGSRCTTGTLDRSIYAYSSACYYERVYIQGGNLLDNTRETHGHAPVLRDAAPLPRRSPLGAGAHADAARRARCRDAAGPVPGLGRSASPRSTEDSGARSPPLRPASGSPPPVTARRAPRSTPPT